MGAAIRRSRRTVAGGLLLLLAATACRHDAHTADPCRVVRRNEVSSIVGTRVSTVHSVPAIQPAPGLAFCLYETSSVFGAIEVAVQHPGREVFAQGRQRAEVNTAIRPALAPVNGLGDAAFSVGGGVQVLKGDYYLVVQPQTFDPRAGADEFTTLAKQLAAKAIRRLP
jgi:hypothetical protein